MVRQYRLEHFNGMEILVCEVFQKHLFNQVETQAFLQFNEHNAEHVPQAEFRVLVNEELDKPGVDSYLGLTEPIPVFDLVPSLVVRAPVVDNRPAQLQVDFLRSVTSLEIQDEVKRFLDVFRSAHWRASVSRQVESYGSLFASEDDS